MRVALVGVISLASSALGYQVKVSILKTSVQEIV